MAGKVILEEQNSEAQESKIYHNNYLHGAQPDCPICVLLCSGCEIGVANCLDYYFLELDRQRHSESH